MKTPHILMALLGLLFVSALVLDGPPQSIETPDKILITYWEKWTGFEGEAMKATVELFNSKKIKNKKGQVIEVKYFATAQVDRKTLLATAGGIPPDLGGVWMRQAPLWSELNGVITLDDYIKRDHFDMDKFMPIYRRMCENRGKVICMLTTPATTALHWNKDLFLAAGLDPERPPQTLQEIEEYNVKLTKRDPTTGKLLQTGYLPVEPGWFNWAFGYWFGGKLNDGEAKLTPDDPKNIEAWKWLLKFAGKDKSEADQQMAFRQAFGTFDSPQNAFLAGKVAMVVQGVWMANYIKFNNPLMHWGCAPFPTSFENKGEPVTVADADVIVLPRGCRHPEEAWEFMKFVDSHEGMEFLCKGQGKLTPFRENTPGWIESHPHPLLKVFIDQARSKNAVMLPRVALSMEYLKEISDAFERCWLKNAEPETALKDIRERLQAKNERRLEVMLRRQARQAGAAESSKPGQAQP